MTVHTWIEINKQNLIDNYASFVTSLGKDHCIPIIKSNAYGHGLKEVFECLASEDPSWLGVNYLFEAETLRSLGYKNNILIVGPLLPEDLEKAYKLNVDFFLGSKSLLNAWIKAKNKAKAHIKFDTGMSRQGFSPDEAKDLSLLLKPHKKNLIGICTHLSNVEDVLKHEYAEKQLQSFNKARDHFKDFSLIAHAASSASSLLLEHSHFEMSRIGISLFGQWPSEATRLSYLHTFNQLTELKPVLSWHTVVMNKKTVKKNQFIGYGCTYKARQDMTIAVLPVGYYEGYPRLTGEHQSYVLLKGERCPIVGRICMNMLMVDISHISETEEGDTVTLIGEDRNETISASDIAGWAETIHYEILTNLNSLIPRRIV